MTSERHLRPAPGSTLRYAARTDVGLKRGHNEDLFGVHEEEQLFIVADGMGGHACGEVASQLAVDVMMDFFVRSREPNITWPFQPDATLSQAENRLGCAIKVANAAIHAEAQSTPARRGMGTTIVAAAVADGHVHFGHVGDSRAYRLRAGALTRLTRDHSLLQEYLDAGGALTAQEQEAFPHKNVITRAVGMHEMVEPTLSRSELLVGDRVLLCSDGLSGMLPEPVLQGCLESGPDLDAILVDLIDRANRAGGVDNITAIVVERLA